MANLRTKILDLRGFDSSRILIFRGEIFMSIGSFPELLSQRIVERVLLVGRLGVGSSRTMRQREAAAAVHSTQTVRVVSPPVDAYLNLDAPLSEGFLGAPC